MVDRSHPLARYAQRVRVLAEARLPPGRVDEAVRRTLEGLAREMDLAGGPIGDPLDDPPDDPPADLPDRVYRRARATIDAMASETDRPLDLPDERGGGGRVARCLERLAEPDRTILRLAFQEGLSPAEISERMEIDRAEACRLKRRALERFTELYLDRPER